MRPTLTDDRKLRPVLKPDGTLAWTLLHDDAWLELDELADDLDVLVHEAKGEEAARINNAGPGAQIGYLFPSEDGRRAAWTMLRDRT